MAQKTETPKTATAKAEPETSAVPSATPIAAESKPLTDTASPVRTGAIGLSPELTELVMELRDTVKGLNPRKLTVKTLRRSLSLVKDILAEIDKL